LRWTGFQKPDATRRVENRGAKNRLFEKTVKHRFEIGFQTHFLGTDLAQMLFDRLAIMGLGQMDRKPPLMTSFTNHTCPSLLHSGRRYNQAGQGVFEQGHPDLVALVWRDQAQSLVGGCGSQNAGDDGPIIL
jgi:hypothetical protein